MPAATVRVNGVALPHSTPSASTLEINASNLTCGDVYEFEWTKGEPPNRLCRCVVIYYGTGRGERAFLDLKDFRTVYPCADKNLTVQRDTFRRLGRIGNIDLA